MNQLLKAKISLLSQSKALAIYGAALCLGHLVTAYYWSQQDIADHFSKEFGYTFCWPFFPNCHDWRFFSEKAAAAIIYTYGIISVIACLLFLRAKTTGLGYIGLCTLFLLKIALYSQSYGLMGNYHYMSLIIDFIYLFLPAGHLLLPLQVILFYFFAGALKIDMEWISGASVPFDWIAGKIPYHYIYTRPHLMVPLSIYAAFMELVVVFGLLLRNRYFFWFSFLNLLGFHLFSWGIVGYLYPLIMICLIAIFPLLRIFPLSEERSIAELIVKIVRKPTKFVCLWLFIFCFSFLQVYHRALPGDSALTGQGRIFALNMLDATTECYSAAYAHVGDEWISVGYERKQSNFAVRLWCEPYVYFQRAKAACREFSNTSGFQGVSLRLNVKRKMSPSYSTIISEKNICDKTYSAFFLNSWIRVE